MLHRSSEGISLKEDSKKENNQIFDKINKQENTFDVQKKNFINIVDNELDSAAAKLALFGEKEIGLVIIAFFAILEKLLHQSNSDIILVETTKNEKREKDDQICSTLIRGIVKKLNYAYASEKIILKFLEMLLENFQQLNVEIIFQEKENKIDCLDLNNLNNKSQSQKEYRDKKSTFSNNFFILLAFQS